VGLRGPTRDFTWCAQHVGKNQTPKRQCQTHVINHLIPKYSVKDTHNMALQKTQTQNNKAKHWCFTINNPTELDYATLIMFRPQTTYMVYGVEHSVLRDSAGVAKTPHLQGYFCLVGQKTRTALSKILDRAHLEVKRGTVRDAIDYCKKGDQTHEEWSKFKTAGPHYGRNAEVHQTGEEPLEQNEAGHKASMEKYEETMEKAKSGNFDEINAKHSLLYFNNIRNVRQEVINNKPRVALSWNDGAPPNLWIWGPTGTGKSKKVWDEYPDAYRKMCNKWWDGYNDQPTVVLEDIGLTHEYLGDHLKIWADRFPFRSEMKGRTVMLRPERIVITSNYHPDQLWKDPGVLNPILRRFAIVKLDTIKEFDDSPPPRPRKTKASKHHSEERPSKKKKPALYRQDATGSIVLNKKPVTQRELLFHRANGSVIDLTGEDSSSDSLSSVSKSWQDDSGPEEGALAMEQEGSCECSLDDDERLLSWCRKCDEAFMDCPCKF